MRDGFKIPLLLIFWFYVDLISPVLLFLFSFLSSLSVLLSLLSLFSFGVAGSAAIQNFSWDWQGIIVGALATPISLGLLFAYFVLGSMGAAMSETKDKGRLNGMEVENELLLLFFFCFFLFMCFVFLYTMWRLSHVASATCKLHRLLDFALERKHISHSEIRAIVCETRHLIDHRGSVKLFGGKITRMFVFRIVKFMFKVLSIGASVLVVGQTTGRSAGGSVGVAQNLTTVAPSSSL